MKKRLVLFLVIICSAVFFAGKQTAETISPDAVKTSTAGASELRPQQFSAAAFAVSGKVSELAPASPANGAKSRKDIELEVPNNEPFRKQSENAPHDADSAVSAFSAAPMPAPALSFDGISSNDNAAAYSIRIVPPDPNGDIGVRHYVQTVNALTRVYDKSGSPLTPPFKMSSIFSALGTTCSARNDGDPIALYDALADRWILSQFCNNFPPFRQLIAVSTTSDPTGAFYVYEFVMPNIKLNDYPKLAVWTDGYYMSTDEFIGSEYAGTGVFAFDKSKMLAGDPSAGYIYIDLASPSTIRFGGLLPADFDGLNAPPPNAPNIFAGYAATEYGDAQDALRLFDFHADFANPNDSTFTERAESPIAVAAFDPTSPNGRADIEQPSPGDKLDSQSDRLMYRAAYRNFGTHESLILNQTVRVSPVGQNYRAGVRVYELRNVNSGFGVHEQATIGSSASNRWMGSAAQDFQGNIALGYSYSNAEKRPSILYSGKLASEPSMTFRAENTLISGTGVQAGFGSRWGDYSSISIDPIDDCTFWITNEYYTAEGEAENPFSWRTRIGNFKFPECTNAPRAVINGSVTNSATGDPIKAASITADQVYSRRTDAAGAFENFYLVPGAFTLKIAADGFRTHTETITLSPGETLTRSFPLEPAAVLTASDYELTGESCTTDEAVDPGETVTLRVALRNSGAKSTMDLTAELTPTGGVISPDAPKNYGALSVGASRAQSFTFTASPNLRCGSALILTLRLQDGAEDLGTVSIPLHVGTARFALLENFDAASAPALPAGWSTSAVAPPNVWKTKNTIFKSPPNSAFSADFNHIGVSDLVSPTFRVSSEAATLTFQNRYDHESTFLRNKLYDGGVLEIKIGERGRFRDILDSGGVFESGGYDGVIDGCCQNPLAGRSAWSGKSGPHQEPSFVKTKIRLPVAAAGKKVQLRWRVGTDLGAAREGQYIDDVTVSDGFACACQKTSAARAPFDFDGDGKTDLSVYRLNDDAMSPDFSVRSSSSGETIATAWGSVGDAAVNADYDNDGKTDYAVFRPASSTWFILRSSDGTMFSAVFGLASDILTPADYDGDGKSDIAVYRPENGFWHIRQSSDNLTRSMRFGAAEDLTVPNDYDGDGKADIAVYRPSTGVWYVLSSSTGILSARQFGAPEDRPVPGDFDGDGKADYAVYRPSSGTWYLLKTSESFSAVKFGAADDTPLQADLDGDGKRDIAVYRRNTGDWHYLKSSNGEFVSVKFGTDADAALPSIYLR